MVEQGRVSAVESIDDVVSEGVEASTASLRADLGIETRARY
jgi:hypothetical protein